MTFPRSFIFYVLISVAALGHHFPVIRNGSRVFVTKRIQEVNNRSTWLWYHFKCAFFCCFASCCIRATETFGKIIRLSSPWERAILCLIYTRNGALGRINTILQQFSTILTIFLHFPIISEENQRNATLPLHISSPSWYKIKYTFLLLFHWKTFIN